MELARVEEGAEIDKKSTRGLLAKQEKFKILKSYFCEAILKITNRFREKNAHFSTTGFKNLVNRQAKIFISFLILYNQRLAARASIKWLWIMGEKAKPVLQY